MASFYLTQGDGRETKSKRKVTANVFQVRAEQGSMGCDIDIFPAAPDDAKAALL